MVAPAYAEARSSLAKQMGLGQQRRNTARGKAAKSFRQRRDAVPLPAFRAARLRPLFAADPNAGSFLWASDCTQCRAASKSRGFCALFVDTQAHRLHDR